MRQINYIKKVNIYRKEMPIWFRNILKTFFITFLIFCLFITSFTFIYYYTPVEGESMYPTLNEAYYSGHFDNISTDSVYINRFANYSRGNIVIFNKPSELSSNYVVKRLIATGGDKLAIAPITNFSNESQNIYKIFIIKNGSSIVEILSETYLSEISQATKLYHTYLDFTNYRVNIAHEEGFTTINNIKVNGINYGSIHFLTLKNDQVFLLGDNREHNGSFDSADYGPVPSSKYVGRVDIIAYQSANNLEHVVSYFWHKIFNNYSH